MNEAFVRKPLGEIIVESGYAKAEDVQNALQAPDTPLGEALLSNQHITEDQLAQALAIQCGYPYQNIHDFTITEELFASFPAELAYKYNVIPFAEQADELTVISSDPLDLTLAERLEKQTGLNINIHIASPSAIEHCLRRSEGSLEVLKGLSREFQLMMVVENAQGNEEQVSLDDHAAPEDGPVIKLVNSILLAALNKHASDIHIEATARGTDAKYRIDGVLYPATETLDRKHHNELVSRIKIMSELDITETRVPQDGRFRLRHAGRDIDFRVSVLPSVFGEDIAIRVLDRAAVETEFETLSLDSLGLPPAIQQDFAQIVQAPYGMILITGPTGSGKTTTLYAGIKTLDLQHEKVITIEDPVEYQLAGVTQIPVNEKKGLTFGKGLRSILRHDPDKIMVGEIRDEETARIALQSALTGHLVFSTVHANDTIDVIERFRYMGIDVYELVSAITCIMAQRLVRKLCHHCKQPLSADTLKQYEWASGLVKPGKGEWMEPVGCDHCMGTGYRGRTLIIEYLPLAPDIKQQMIDRLPLHQIKENAKKNGMQTLRESAIALVSQGITSLSEVQRVTFG